MKNLHLKLSLQILALFTILALLANLAPVAQAEALARPQSAGGDLTWARSIGGIYGEEGYEVAVDANGNTYITGGFNSANVDFDPGPGVFSMTSTGGDDVFLAKYDSNDDFVWAISMGEPYGSDAGISIAFDANNNVYLIGSFKNTMDFDPGPSVYELNSAGSDDIFVSKFDSNGSFVWAKGIGGTKIDIVTGVAVDSSGIYITGWFGDIVDFDPGPSAMNLTSAGEDDIFVSKLDQNGNFVWAKSMGSGMDDNGWGLDLDKNGNVYLTGYFTGLVDFDPGIGVKNLASAGNTDIFVAKFGNTGNFIWAENMGGAYFDHGYDIALDSDDNIFVTGTFQNIADFDPGASEFMLASAGNDDIFITKLNNNGGLIWAEDMGGTADDTAWRIVADRNSYVYVTGYFNGTADFDPGIGISNLTSSGSTDIFIVNVKSDGSFMWAKGIGGVGDDYGYSIAVDTSGYIYVTGSFRGTTDFDPGVGVSNLTSSGYYDIFLLKLERDIHPIFTDVPLNYWAWTYIERLYNAGVTGGCSTSPMLYCPTTTVTRDQMAVFLLRGEHGSSYVPPAATGSMFADVPSTHWAAAWIEQLANEGITGGCGNGNYCPSTPVTRDQMAVFLLRGEHGGSYVPPEATGAMFADVPSTHWAAAWIEQLANEGITGGCGGGNYCPGVIVTRDQMAVFLVRAFNLP